MRKGTAHATKAAWIAPHLRVRETSGIPEYISHEEQEEVEAAPPAPVIHACSSGVADGTASLSELSQSLATLISKLEPMRILDAHDIALFQAAQAKIQALIPKKSEGEQADHHFPTRGYPSASTQQATTQPPPARTPDEGTCEATVEQASSPRSDTIGPITDRSGPAPVSLAKAKGKGDRQDQVFFASWGQREKRDTPAAKSRTVVITALPDNATPKFIASIVYGGALELIQLRSSAEGSPTATVRFMNAEACKHYSDETANGVVYMKTSQDRESVAFVTPSREVDVVGGMLQRYIANGVTRCVRAVGVEGDWGEESLKRMAEMKGTKLEGISDEKNPGSARTVTFRFCKIEDAIQFKGALMQDENWEPCNIQFATDPCAAATGVHFDD